MQYFDTPDPQKMFKVAAILFFAFLGCLIIFLALVTNEDQPSVTPPAHGATAAHTDSDINVTEEAIPLADGRTVVCLFFSTPAHQIVCDWNTARNR